MLSYNFAKHSGYKDRQSRVAFCIKVSDANIASGGIIKHIKALIHEGDMGLKNSRKPLLTLKGYVYK